MKQTVPGFLPEKNPILPGQDDSVILVPLKDFTPGMTLNKTDHLPGSLIYTVSFLVIFALIRLRGKNLLPLLVSVLFKRKKYEIIQNEGVMQNSLYYLLSLLLSFSALSIASIYLTQGCFDVKSISYLFSFFCIWHFSFLCIIQICGWTFNALPAAEEAIIHIWAYHIMMGLFIAPFILAIFFVKPFAIELLSKLIVICLILFYLVKFLRWIEILLVHRVSIFYMILYLCALEVIPLLILYKLLL